MKMKKFMAVLLVAITMLLVLGGCGNTKPQKSSSEAETGETAKEEPTKATLILYGEGSERMSDFAANEFHDKVLEAINVDVTVQYLPWSEYAGGKTELMLSTGEKFVTYTDVQFLAKCVAKGYYADLTEAADKYAGDLKKNCGGEEAFDTWKIDGKLYA